MKWNILTFSIKSWCISFQYMFLRGLRSSSPSDLGCRADLIWFCHPSRHDNAKGFMFDFTLIRGDRENPCHRAPSNTSFLFLFVQESSCQVLLDMNFAAGWNKLFICLIHSLPEFSFFYFKIPILKRTDVAHCLKVWEIWQDKVWRGICLLICAVSEKWVVILSVMKAEQTDSRDWCFVTANQYLSAGSVPRSSPRHDWGPLSSCLISQANLKQMMCTHTLQSLTSDPALRRFKLSKVCKCMIKM